MASFLNKSIKFICEHPTLVLLSVGVSASVVRLAAYLISDYRRRRAVDPSASLLPSTELDSLMSVDSKSDTFTAFSEACRLQRQGRVDEAIEKYTEAIACSPASAKLYINRGLLHLQNKSWINARADATAAISILPSPKAFYIRGRANVALHQHQLAFDDFATALNFHNVDPHVRRLCHNWLCHCTENMPPTATENAEPESKRPQKPPIQWDTFVERMSSIEQQQRESSSAFPSTQNKQREAAFELLGQPNFQNTE